MFRLQKLEETCRRVQPMIVAGGVLHGLKKVRGAASCKFLTTEIMGVQNLIFAPKFSQYGTKLNVPFWDEDFPTRR